MANKEHIFQIGISIDEDEIISGVNEQVRNVVLKNIESRYLDEATFYSSRRVPTEYLKSLVDNQIISIISENKDEIIKIAGESLAERLFKTKAAKETLKRITEAAE